jgi:hypothetical protein
LCYNIYLYLCKSVPRQKPSLWPPGPFAIPRSSYGCPESESRGWTKSVLYRKKPGKNKQEDPLNLCVKLRNDTELDTEKWIPGRYTIYRIGEECPAGLFWFGYLMCIYIFMI